MSERVYIKDDNGCAWYFTGDRIRAVGDNTANGGYLCWDFESGIELLNQLGYIGGRSNTASSRRSGARGNARQKTKAPAHG
jgi:hypothetical protein